MKIEQVEFIYVAMPEIQDIGDGSQDALLVRVDAGGHTGWGECEAAPLVSIASFYCPRSHLACKPLQDSVLGHPLNGPDDIRRLHALVRQNSLDLLQASHTLSGIDMALWDILGKMTDEPVYRLLGYERAYPKTPYASQLFGNEPQETLQKGRESRKNGFKAVKFGWGPFGRGTVQADIDQLHAAREGIGSDGILLVDAGTVWDGDITAAEQRLAAMEQCNVHWLEEPFDQGALDAYRALGEKTTVRMAGGEGSHNAAMARHLIDYGRVDYIQIDAGRIGGITPARQVADYAAGRGIKYVNHTFTTNLALSASLQPFAGLEEHVLCEYPVEATPLAANLTNERLTPDADGRLILSDAPGLGVTVNPETIETYRQEVDISVNGTPLIRP